MVVFYMLRIGLIRHIQDKSYIIHKEMRMNWRGSVINSGMKLIGHQLPKILDEINRWEYCSKATHDAKVQEKLWNLLAHTWSKVPFYYNLKEKFGSFSALCARKNL